MASVRKALGLLVCAVVLSAAGGLALAWPAAAAPPPAQESDACLGTNPEAPVVVEVFSDYQCPACRRFYLEVGRQVLADYAMKGKVCVVYREFPLQQHQHAREAARYARAAGRLGREQWIKVTDALYFHQSSWSNTGQVEDTVARALSDKEMEKVRKWVDADPAIDAEITEDMQEGRQRGVSSTPTIFVTADGKSQNIPSGVAYANLRRYLDSLLQR